MLDLQLVHEATNFPNKNIILANLCYSGKMYKNFSMELKKISMIVGTLTFHLQVALPQPALENFGHVDFPLGQVPHIPGS